MINEYDWTNCCPRITDKLGNNCLHDFRPITLKSIKYPVISLSKIRCPCDPCVNYKKIQNENSYFNCGKLYLLIASIVLKSPNDMIVSEPRIVVQLSNLLNSNGSYRIVISSHSIALIKFSRNKNTLNHNETVIKISIAITFTLCIDFKKNKWKNCPIKTIKMIMWWTQNGIFKIMRIW